MNFLLDFFGASPARLQQLLIGALVGLVLCLGLAGYGLWWRAEAYQARAELEGARGQVAVLAQSLTSCSASIDRSKQVADASIAAMGELVERARRLAAPRRAEFARLEALLERPTPAGAGCAEAWTIIEAEHLKTRGP